MGLTWINPNGADAPGNVLPSSLLPMKVLTSRSSVAGAACRAGATDRASTQASEASGADTWKREQRGKVTITGSWAGVEAMGGACGAARRSTRLGTQSGPGGHLDRLK